jgi:hypothetical protein
LILQVQIQLASAYSTVKEVTAETAQRVRSRRYAWRGRQNLTSVSTSDLKVVNQRFCCSEIDRAEPLRE